MHSEPKHAVKLSHCCAQSAAYFAKWQQRQLRSTSGHPKNKSHESINGTFKMFFAQQLNVYEAFWKSVDIKSLETGHPPTGNSYHCCHLSWDTHFTTSSFEIC